MGRQPSRQRQSGQRSRQARSRRQRSSKQRTRGLWLLLIVLLLALGAWEALRLPPGFLIAGSMAVVVLVLLLLMIWFLRRYQLTPEEQDWQKEQRMEAARMEATAQAIGARPLELEDLAHLGDKEFEYFTGALLEAMGILSEWECVGGAADHGIDLRGKDRNGLLHIVQCKRFFGYKVASKYTREFGWAIGLHGAYRAWFVTTTLFSAQARDDVSPLTSRDALRLIDGPTLLEYIHDYWNALPARGQWRLTECMGKRDRQRATR
jgi:hypothetical protein